jgi:hypothetical protein
MFEAKDVTILMSAAIAALFCSIAIIESGDCLIGGFVMLVSAYTAFIATLPGAND